MNAATGQPYPVHATIEGPLVLIGLGSIGKGVLPLIERHFEFDPARLTIIDPDPEVATYLEDRDYAHVQEALTPENYDEILSGLFTEPGGFCVNLSVDTSSLDLMRTCRRLGTLYIDTVVEPWPGLYFGDISNEKRTKIGRAHV